VVARAVESSQFVGNFSARADTLGLIAESGIRPVPVVIQPEEIPGPGTDILHRCLPVACRIAVHRENLFDGS
jgi:hypothetical protein